MNNSCDWIQLEKIIKELELYHHLKLMALGREIVPTLTEEDLLQPNDFPNLENNPLFRYEEGLLAGIRTVQTVLNRYKNQDSSEDDFHQMEL